MTTQSAHLTNLKNIQNGQKIKGEPFLVLSLQEGTTSKGTPYYTVTLANKHGSMPVKIFEVKEKLSEGDYVDIWADGEVHNKWGPQWRITTYMSSSYGGDEHFEALVYKPDVEGLFGKMVDYPYQNPTIKKLLKKFLSRKEMVENFKSVPASLTNHHYYTGGLVQHTYEVWEMTACLMDSLEGFVCYPKLQRDVALFSALIHDISKTEEYIKSPDGWDRSNQSRLVGNPAGGMAIMRVFVEELRAEGEELEGEVIDLVYHICISHQMRPEWGSPVSPLCLEAMCVATADGMSATASNYVNALVNDREPNSAFASYYRYYGEGASVWKVPDFKTEEAEKPKADKPKPKSKTTKTKKSEDSEVTEIPIRYADFDDELTEDAAPPTKKGLL